MDRVEAVRILTKMHGVNEVIVLTAKVSSSMNLLKNKLLTASVNSIHVVGVSYAYCVRAHFFDSCHSNPKSICFMGNVR